MKYFISFAFSLSFIFAVQSQITLGFQGGETGDTWGFSSTGADATALAERLLAPNKVTGTQSLVVGGNTAGGSCIDGGSGNGPNTPRTFTFDVLDISQSSNFTRTLSFNFGTRFPTCVGTGWDSGENLYLTPIHDGVAQAPILVATGNNNATFNIQTNNFTYNVPTCVLSFSFTLSITTNRRDELLFIDNVRLTTPSQNPPTPMLSAIDGATSVCLGTTETYNVDAIPNTTFTWSGLPVGATFNALNGTSTSNEMPISWITTTPGTYTLTVTPSFINCGIPVSGTPQSIQVTIATGGTLAISPNVSICAGESTTISVQGTELYLWDQGLGLGNAFQVFPTTTTTYTVNGLLNGCLASGTVVVTVNPIPSIQLTANPTALCLGETATITATGATSYVWQAQASVISTNGNQLVVQPNETTSYSVTGTTNGCEQTAIISIAVNTLPIVDAGPNQTICSGASTSVNPNGATSYVWTGGITSGTVFTPTQTATYTVTGTDVNGCTNTDEITITLTSSPQVEAGNPISICAGESVTLQASGSSNYQWDNGVLDGIPFIPAATFTYTVTAGTGIGCSSTDEVTVTVLPNPIVNAGTDFSICNSDPITLNATGTATYVWDNGASQGVPFTIAQTTTFTVIGTTVNGCVGSDQITVSVNELPTISFDSDVQTGCIPFEVQFNAITNPTNSIAWNIGGINYSGTNPIATIQSTGCKNVIVTVTSPEGCTASFSELNYICPSVQPTAYFTPSAVQLSVEENTIQFTNLSGNANTYFWSFDNLAPTSSLENPEVVFQNFTGLSSVQVSLTATNTDGCFDTYTFPLLIENNLLFFMPNAFTPDGNEFNQTFEPVFSPGFDPFNYQLSIYNRWGELLFESYDMEIGWDGTGKNGLLVTSGTYVWKILVGVTGIDDQKIFHGHVNVMR